jgi:hypothetical protein
MWNPDTAACAAMFIITTMGEDYLACRIVQADEETGKSQRADFWMRPGDILVARYWDGSNGDAIHAYTHGIEYTAPFEIATGA